MANRHAVLTNATLTDDEFTDVSKLNEGTDTLDPVGRNRRLETEFIETGENYLVHPKVTSFVVTLMGVGLEEFRISALLLDKDAQPMDIISLENDDVGHGVSRVGGLAHSDQPPERQAIRTNATEVSFGVHYVIIFAEIGTNATESTGCSLELLNDSKAVADDDINVLCRTSLPTPEPDSCLVLVKLVRQDTYWNYCPVGIRVHGQDPYNILNNDDVERSLQNTPSVDPVIKQIKIYSLGALPTSANINAEASSHALTLFYDMRFGTEQLIYQLPTRTLQAQNAVKPFVIPQMIGCMMDPLMIHVYNDDSRDEEKFAGQIRLNLRLLHSWAPGTHKIKCDLEDKKDMPQENGVVGEWTIYFIVEIEQIQV